MLRAASVLPRFRRAFATRGDAVVAGRFVRLLAPVIAAAVAAVAAHDIIDRLGDVLLARDSYDGVAHASRASLSVVALVLACSAVAAAVWHALGAARCDREALAAFRRTVVGGSRVRSIATVVALTVCAVAGMETFDVLAQGVAIDGFDDLLGGSLALGLGVALPLGAIAGVFAWTALRWIALSHRAVAGAVVAFVLALAPHSRDRVVFRSRRQPVRRRGSASVLAFRAGKRGPPVRLVSSTPIFS